MTALPDVVYVLGPGAGEELRYSLRSLRNVPHGTVWIFGTAPPDWVTGVQHVPVLGRRNRFISTTHNLQAACEHTEVSDDFLLFNDDFYVMRPVAQVPLFHRGTCDELIRRMQWADGRYMAGMRRVRDLCRRSGVEHPLCYEVHTPMPVEKSRMLELLTSPEFFSDRQPADLADSSHAHKRTLYGNLMACDREPVRTTDPKVHTRRGGFDPAAMFLSTDRWFPNSDIARHIAAALPDPSPYELLHG